MLNKIFKTFLAFFIVFSVNVFSQEMNPEAGKLYNEGNSLLKAGNYNGAIDKYNQALAIEKDYRIYYQKGIALKKADKLDESRIALEECLKLSPNNEAALNALGGTYFSMGDYQKAIDTFEKVLSVTKNNSVKDKVRKNMSLAYTKLGNQAMSSGNANKAIEYLTKAVELDKYDAAYLLLAQLYQELGQYDNSIKAAEDALKYRSKINKGGAYYYMGLAYKGKGDMTQAKGDPSYRANAEYQLGLMK
jgi:tetratricopeptide (TPR) repeat protein